MASIFTKIINREIPSDIFYEDEKFISILDINPVRDGHILVIPKQEVDYIFDLNDEDYKEFMFTVKKVARILEEKIKTHIEFDRIAVVVEGLLVPHVHVHLIPINKGDTLSPQVKNKFGLDGVKKILFG